MKRPALYLGVPFAIGLVTASFIVQQLWLLVCGSVTVVALTVLLWRRELWKYVLLSTLSCLTACCVYWHADAHWQHTADAFLPCEDTYCGTVVKILPRGNGYACYVFDGSFAQGITARTELLEKAGVFDYGDTVTLIGYAQETTGSYLYGANSYKAENILFTFDSYALVITDVRPLDGFSLRKAIYGWRTEMTRRIRAGMDAETAELLIGMLFGDTSGMERGSKTALYRMGIGHLLAVSGLHLDFLALCAAFLLEKLGAGKKLRFVLIAVLCGLFVICAGETVSVRRACIMVLLSQSAGLFYRKSDPLNSLSIAMLLLGAANPFVIHSAAFWLSCSGAFGIGVFAPYMTARLPQKTALQKCAVYFAGLCCVFVAVLPASAIYFRELSLLSPVSNALLVPVCMAALLLGVLAVLCGGQGALAQGWMNGAETLERAVLWISRRGSAIPWTHAAAESSVLLRFLLLGAGFALLCHLICRQRKVTAAAICLSLAVTVISTQAERFVQRDALKIAVLGSERECVLVVCSGEEAVILDMTGVSESAAYACAYCTGAGVHTLQGLYLCKPTARNTAKYAEYFTSLPPEEVVLLQAEAPEWRVPFDTLVQTDLRRELLLHGAHITMKNGQVMIAYGGVTYLCTKDAGSADLRPEVLTVYGRSSTAVPDCGILIIQDAQSGVYPDAHTYVGEQDLEITITSDGKCRVRRLYGGT